MDPNLHLFPSTLHILQCVYGYGVERRGGRGPRGGDHWDAMVVFPWLSLQVTTCMLQVCSPLSVVTAPSQSPVPHATGGPSLLRQPCQGLFFFFFSFPTAVCIVLVLPSPWGPHIILKAAHPGFPKGLDTTKQSWIFPIYFQQAFIKLSLLSSSCIPAFFGVRGSFLFVVVWISPNPPTLSPLSFLEDNATTLSTEPHSLTLSLYLSCSPPALGNLRRPLI